MAIRVYLSFVIMLLFLLQAAVEAQSGGVPFNQRDDKYTLLGLKRARAGYEAARQEYERKKRLFEEDLISNSELSEAGNRFADAEVNYQQSLLAVIFESQYVTISRAVKYQAKDGRKHVKLRLENTSGSSEYKHLAVLEDDVFKSLRPDIVHDVYVSLLNEQNAIISKPYEAKIEVLKSGTPAEIDFTLLQDVNEVTVNLVYGRGSQRSPRIYLEKDARVERVLVQAQQFSQEVEYGAGASFDLTLELFSGSENIYKLAVVNLPQQINRYFTDPVSGARLSQFKFSQSNKSRQAALQIFLPDRPGDDIRIDKSISFYILIIPQNRVSTLALKGSKTWTKEEIDSLKIGFVQLEVIPRGIGILLVRAPQLYYAVQSGEAVNAELTIKNEGSRRLDNIDFEIDMPLGWQKQLLPDGIPSLAINQEENFLMNLIPDADTPPGKYEIRVRTSSVSDNQPVSGEDKTITIEILTEANIFGTAIIVLLILALVAGIVIFGVRLTRR